MEPMIAALCLLLLLAGDVLLVVLLVRSRRPDDADRQQELESWLEERLARQADDFGRLLQMSQDALSKQNYAAIRGVKDAVDGMGVQLTGGQSEAIGRNYGRTRDAMLSKGTKVLTAALFVLTIIISIIDKFSV